MTNWKENAIKLLGSSLHPVPTEYNALDWKSDLSTKTERLAQHISAFANHEGGGMFVFGVNNDGSHFSINMDKAEEIVRRLGNIALNNLSAPIALDHDILEYEGDSLLFVYVPEQKEKPVYLRGKSLFDSYCRSAGSTVKMPQAKVKSLIAHSQGISFEERLAMTDVSPEEVMGKLNYRKFFELIERNVPTTQDAIIDKMTAYDLCVTSGDGSYAITNMGALLFANDLTDFPSLRSKNVWIRKYAGTNNRQCEMEISLTKGYAVGFERMIDQICALSSTENIETLRSSHYVYPKVAIREVVANALVHQDFEAIGMLITVEVFSNRMTITNPGTPLNDIKRLIDLPPHSRNERLAEMMYQLRMCEKRGSGLDRAIESIEQRHLPPLKFEKSEEHTKVTFFPPKPLSEMTKQEKIEACYQHACLANEDNKPINNQSVRERFNIDKKNSAIASRIISDTLNEGLIKLQNPGLESKKFARYVPFYA